MDLGFVLQCARAVQFYTGVSTNITLCGGTAIHAIMKCHSVFRVGWGEGLSTLYKIQIVCSITYLVSLVVSLFAPAPAQDIRFMAVISYLLAYCMMYEYSDYVRWRQQHGMIAQQPIPAPPANPVIAAAAASTTASGTQPSAKKRN